MIKIDKIAKDSSYIRMPYYFDSARDAWGEVIKYFLEKNPNTKVLLPAYIGFSSNEGSGIFDPVKNHKCTYNFYNFKSDLSIDFESLKEKVLDDTNCIVLLVHYFGFPDIRYNEICTWLEQNNIPFIEDCAHALFSDYIGGVCGGRGLFSFYSLHKMLPLNTGGMLISNYGINIDNDNNKIYPIFNFDFKSIFDKRRENYNTLLELLKDVDSIEILHANLFDGICPQTLPILVKRNRDIIYSKMNENGFGFVSLYHTMIKDISEQEHPEAYYLAKHITNLPVHQDVDKSYYYEMVELLKSYL